TSTAGVELAPRCFPEQADANSTNAASTSRPTARAIRSLSRRRRWHSSRRGRAPRSRREAPHPRQARQPRPEPARASTRLFPTVRSLPEQLSHLVVARLREVLVPQPDRVEGGGRERAHDLVDVG